MTVKFTKEKTTQFYISFLHDMWKFPTPTKLGNFLKVFILD